MAYEKLTKLAISSRIILLSVQLTTNILLPDHNPDVFKSPKSPNSNSFIFDAVLEFLFGGLRRWDAEYFLHIAEYGYTYENNLVFYPLFPATIHWITKILIAITFYTSSFRAMSLTVSVILNIYFFNGAAHSLYDLTHRIYGDTNKSWMAVVLFCFNPASIFFTAPYSESLYCYLSFSLMLCCVNRIPFVKTTCVLGLSILTRSNGLLNFGYPIYFTLRKLILKKKSWSITKLIAISLLALIPFSVFNFYIFKIFCFKSSNIVHSSAIIHYGKLNGYVLAGQRLLNNSPWCEEKIPFPYSYIQTHYWDVGFLNYYKFKQIPNFLIASPMLIFLSINIMNYLKKILTYFGKNGLILTIKDWKSLPFILHCLFLIIFSVLFVHIQISTRLIASANPCLFWFGSDCLPKTFDQINFKKYYSILIYWFGAYFIVGTILFSNFYPWT